MSLLLKIKNLILFTILKFKCKIQNNYYFLILTNCYYKVNNQLKISSYRHCFLLPTILNYFNIQIPEDATPLINFSFSIFLVTTICILSFCNVIGFLLAIIFIQKYDVENKFKSYPKIIKLINYYKNSTLILILIEAGLCLFCLLVLEFTSLAVLGIIVF